MDSKTDEILILDLLAVQLIDLTLIEHIDHRVVQITRLGVDLLVLDHQVVQTTNLGVDLLEVIVTDHQVELITRLEVTVLDHQVELTTSLGVDLQGVLVIDHREVRTTELVLIVLIDLRVGTRTDLLQEVLIDLRVEIHTDLVLAVLIDLRVVLHIDLHTKITSVHLQHKDFRVLEEGNTSNLLEVRCGENHLDQVTEVLPSNKIPSLA